MEVTRETRRESYDQILETLGKRQRDVYFELNLNPDVTANELAFIMYHKGYFPKPERNFVHPRLNELVSQESVEIMGKRKCSVTGKKCAVYRVCGSREDGQLSFL